MPLNHVYILTAFAFLLANNWTNLPLKGIQTGKKISPNWQTKAAGDTVYRGYKKAQTILFLWLHINNTLFTEISSHSTCEAVLENLENCLMQPKSSCHVHAGLYVEFYLKYLVWDH